MELTLNERKNALTIKLDSLKNKQIDSDSNFKFMNLLRSRLLEEGIPIEAATQIVVNINYDLSAVNEDDDYIGDVALTYAEFCAKIYSKLKANNWHKNIDHNMVTKFFMPFEILI
jgi:signal recognition particle GTPase